MAWEEYETDLALAAARWHLGLLDADGVEIQALAIRFLLEDGYASPALYRLLAGTRAVALGDDLDWLIAQAFTDVGYPLPTGDEARLLLARVVARDIIDGRVEPYEGVLRISAISHVEEDNRHWQNLAIFRGFDSSIDGDPGLVSGYEPQIKAAAKRLLSD